MKNICLFPTIMLPVPNTKGGAIETLITNLIDRNEIEKKINFTVISIYDEKAEIASNKYKYTNFIFIKITKIDKCKIFLYKVIRKILNIEIPYLYSCDYKAYKKLRAVKFDYIFAEGGLYHNFSLFRKKYGKKKLVAHIHHTMKSDRKINEIFGKIVAISEYVKNEWIITSENKEQNKIYVLKNAIDIKKFDKGLSNEIKAIIKKDLGFEDDDFVVLFCGRIVEEKGVLELIKAIETINDDHIKLLIVGSPNFGIHCNTKYLMEVEEKIKINNKIKKIGYIDNSQLYKYYNISDVMVIPSIWEEAAGLVAIEAMTAGKPIIATKSGGMVEYLEKECAVIIDKNYQIVNNIIKSINYLKTNPNIMKEMGVKSKENAIKYGSEQYYNNFLKMLNEFDNEKK